MGFRMVGEEFGWEMGPVSISTEEADIGDELEFVGCGFQEKEPDRSTSLWSVIKGTRSRGLLNRSRSLWTFWSGVQ